ncbi:hypothetical protein JY651_26175 [Pyxidicoccus parkwayensis]|uniref:Adenosine deaminase n=1 Tax=Pyxidicoccus parkwayensis TaxID=2813578 RepID=A0ABX7NRQ2_9BACT|nr:hypothetical protein [Pyxidicoccus parkwaysis]QSQ18848.1 hypothetical protein JY651_26175 [Pyxidicoccus parkwaysis]
MTTIANTPHLEAEVLSWPFTSELCFELSVSALVRNSHDLYVGDSQRLADALLDKLRPMARGMSLEVLKQIREQAWFAASVMISPRGDRKLPLERLLLHIASKHLLALGHQVTLSYDEEHSIERLAERWRWVSLVLPPDLLIAATSAASRTAPTTDFISLGTAHLGHFFQEEGIAQAHLHLGAAVPFEWLWTHLMARIGPCAPPAAKLQSKGGVPFGSPETFLDWLVTAALARLTLASFLWHSDSGLVKRDGTPAFIPFVRRLVARGSDASLHLKALAALAGGRGAVGNRQLRPVLRRFQREGPGLGTSARRPRTLEDIRSADPLYAWFDTRQGALPETRLAARALGFILDNPGEEHFAQLFWQYQRIRNRTYRHLVQQPGTAGLDWFTIHYSRISALRLDMDTRVLMSSALALESRGLPLKSLEVRTAPERLWHLNRRLILDVATARGPRSGAVERGLMLHFVKVLDREDRSSGRMRHADPVDMVYGCRFGSYYQRRHYEVVAIERALRRHPELLIYLRGMDTCNLELAIPTWVFLPLLARLREASREAARMLVPYARIPPFRLTLHAGEDFRRLAEGLRRMHEPLEFGALQPGDRMGHAFALALDPEAWATTAPTIWQPREELLDDLIWELARYRAGDMHGEAGRVDWLHGRIDRLARDIYADAYRSVEDLILARRLRHSPGYLLGTARYPFMLNASLLSITGSARDMAFLYLTDPGVYVRGQVPEEVVVDAAELRMLHEAQRFLRRLFSRLGITVEVNPSSNMLIGDVPLEAHPLFRLQPLPGQPMPEGGPVLVALGDDDPVTFANSLPDEFCHLFFTLLRRGQGVQEAREWLDQIRRNGLRARFTVPESVLAPEPTSPA